RVPATAKRRTAVGLTSTRGWLGSSTASSLTISRPPQSPGPISLGNNSITAIIASRWLQSLGALATSAVLKSGPAASANECGSGQDGGGGRGKGTVWAGGNGVPGLFFLGFVGVVWVGVDFAFFLGGGAGLLGCWGGLGFCDENESKKNLSDCGRTRLDRKRSPEGCAWAASKAISIDAAPVHSATTKMVAAINQREN